MKTFEEIKSEVIEFGKSFHACNSQFMRVHEAKDNSELLSVIKDNIFWCAKNDRTKTSDLLISLGKEFLKENGVFVSGRHEVTNGMIIAWGNATVEASGYAYLIFHNDKSRHSQEGNSILKEYNTSMIYIKKDSHEIIYT